MTLSLEEVRDMKVIDCDTHIIEPGDLWSARVPARYRDQVPRVVWDEETRQEIWTLGAGSGMPVAGKSMKWPAAGSAMAGWREYPPDRPPTLADADPATYDIHARLAQMDATGIYAQVVYPNIAGFGSGLYAEFPDRELALMCVRAYNDWLVDYTSVAPERFVLNCAVPFWDIDASVQEIKRAREMGHRGILFSSHPNRWGQPWLADPHWDPIWTLVQDLEMPVNFHIGSGGVTEFGVNYEGNGPHVNYAISSSTIYLTNGNAIADTILGGVTHRFPRLKFVSVESGIGWIPFQLQAMDWQWQASGCHELHPDRMLPSEYFRRQFYACFWFERDLLQPTIEYLGEDNILYETDFPHPTSQVAGPCSPGVEAYKYISDALGALPETTRRKILHDNAAKLYNVS